MSFVGAQRHYETLQHIPEGYTYHRKILPKDFGTYEKIGCIIVEGATAYDLDGNEMVGHVVIAMPKERA